MWTMLFILLGFLFVLSNPGIFVVAFFILLFVNPAAIIIFLLTLFVQRVMIVEELPIILNIAVIPLAVWFMIGNEKRGNYFLGKKEDSTIFLFVVYIVLYLWMLSAS